MSGKALFEQSNLVAERKTGKYILIDYRIKPEDRAEHPLVIAASKAERKRLAANPVEPKKRFHYRYQAANLAWLAAKCLPDGDEKTAQMLNTAGSWLKGRDPVAADRFLQAIERRCPNTPTGIEVLKKHWFVHLPPVSLIP